MNEMGSLTDAELIAHYAAGGSALALEALIKRYHPMVRRVAVARAPDAASAMALMENVFLVLAHRAPTLVNLPTISDWLRCVAATEPVPKPKMKGAVAGLN